MAKVDVKMPSDLQEKLSNLGNKTDVIIEKTLIAGGEVALAKVKSNLKSVIGQSTKYPSKSTGELVNALGLSPVKVDNKSVYNVKIGFTEPRKDGGSNAKIANILEYGKHGQPPKPFLAPAKSAVKKQCAEVMKNTLEGEIAKI